MIVIDATSLKDASPGAFYSIIKDWAGRDDVVAITSGNADIDQALRDCGIECVHDEGKQSIGIIQSWITQGEPIERVISDNPLTLSLFSTHPDLDVFSPSDQRHYQIDDVEKNLGVQPERIVDLFLLVGSRDADIAGWFTIGLSEASSLLESGYSLSDLSDPHNSPLKQMPLFSRLAKSRNQMLSAKNHIDHQIWSCHHEKPQRTSQVDPSVLRVDRESDSNKSIESLSELREFLDQTQNEKLSVVVSGQETPGFRSGYSFLSSVVLYGKNTEPRRFSASMPKGTLARAFQMIGEHAEQGHKIITNDAKSLYRCCYLNQNLPINEQAVNAIDDIHVMAFSVDNRTQGMNLVQLMDTYGIRGKKHISQSLYALSDRLAFEMSKPGNEVIEHSYKYRERPLIPLLSEMELSGIDVDRKSMNEKASVLRKQQKVLIDQLRKMAETNDDFNPDNPQEVAHELFNVRNLPIVEKTGSGKPSTQESVLQKLSDQSDFAKRILDYRRITWFINNAFDGVINQINPYSGRIHPIYEQTSSQNGRLSTSQPNIQGMPSTSDLSSDIMGNLVPPKDYRFVRADYDQAELVLMASLSGDSSMENRIRNGLDLHRETACDLFDTEDPTDSQRRSAKAINFGLIYGMTAYGLSKNLGITKHQADTMIQLYFEKKPVIKGYMDAIQIQAKETGMIRTGSGRPIYIENANDPNKARQKKALRSAINAPLQGTIADMVKDAMIASDKSMRQQSLRGQLICQSHDEIIAIAHKDDAQAVGRVIEQSLVNSTPGRCIAPNVEVSIHETFDKKSVVDFDDGYPERIGTGSGAIRPPGTD